MIRHVRHLFTGLALAAGLSCSVFASAQTIYVAGGPISAAATPGVLGTINPITGVFSLIGTTSTELTGIAFSPITGVLYGVSADATTLYTVNAATGALTTVGATGLGTGTFDIADGLAFRSDGTLFLADATGAGGSASNLYTVSTTTGAASVVGAIGNQSSATIGFDGSGNLFEINNQVTPNTLVSLNQSTGAGTTVGSVPFRDISGLAFSNGILFGFTDTNQSGANTTNSVVAVNTTTAGATFISSYNLGNGNVITAATPFQGAAVPEPSTLALLMGMGVTGTGVFLRRKRATASA